MVVVRIDFGQLYIAYLSSAVSAVFFVHAGCLKHWWLPQTILPSSFLTSFRHTQKQKLRE